LEITPTTVLPICLAFLALAVLAALTWIDLKSWILPDKLNLALAFLGLGFHASSEFSLLPPQEMFFGALLGGGLLYVIRFMGNRHYKQDTLGLGDVKLLAAAGVWLGMEGVVMAMTIGAFAGLLHGIGVGLARAIQTKSKPNFNRLMIPAGPGFCLGILLTALWKFSTLFWGV
jgi:leader peptidase (prepilin peptidase)/N-methyltransferase